MDFTSLGRVLIFCAAALFGRFGVQRIPGDLVFRRGAFTVYFPPGATILLSVVGTIVLNLLLRR